VLLPLQLVPFRVVARFTLLQLVYLLGVWALTTWAGIAGIAFPLPIMALVPLRQYLLPLLFSRQHLAELDAASYEEAPPIHDRLQAAQVRPVLLLHEVSSTSATSMVVWWGYHRRMMLTARYCMTALCIMPLNTARHVALHSLLPYTAGVVCPWGHCRGARTAPACDCCCRPDCLTSSSSSSSSGA
jgi:hypothetical protein